MPNKFIKLFEEHVHPKDGNSETSHTWSQVRDVLQRRLPFIIIDFESEDAYNKCIKEELYDEQYAKQSYNLNDGSGNMKEYPSVFIFESRDELTDRVKEFNNKFDILRIIVGEMGEEHPQLHDDSEQVDFGNDVINGLNHEDVGGDDYYKLGSIYYKFIET